MTESPTDRLRPLRWSPARSREFTDRRVDRLDLGMRLPNVAAPSGSSRNTQPWRFIVITDVAVPPPDRGDRRPAGALAASTATAAIAIVLPVDEGHEVGLADDDGRVAERVLTSPPASSGSAPGSRGCGLTPARRSARGPVMRSARSFRLHDHFPRRSHLTEAALGAEDRARRGSTPARGRRSTRSAGRPRLRARGQAAARR